MNDMEKTGKAMQDAGKDMQGCGCLLTIFVTIPLIILIFFIL